MLLSREDTRGLGHPREPTQGAVNGFPPACRAAGSRHPHIAGSVALTRRGAARRCLLFLARSLPLSSPQHGHVRGGDTGCQHVPGVQGRPWDEWGEGGHSVAPGTVSILLPAAALL